MSLPRPNTPSSSFSSSDDESTATAEVLDSSSSASSIDDPMEIDQVYSTSSDESVSASSSETIDDPMEISEGSSRSSEESMEESGTDEDYDQIRYAAKQRFQRADASYKSQDYAKAIEQYNDAIEILTNIPSRDLTVEDFTELEAYYCNLGTALYKVNNREQELVAYLSAFTMLQRIHLIKPLELSYFLEWAASYNLYIADCLNALNNNATSFYQDALLMFTRLNSLKPSLETSLEIARCYFGLKEYQLAINKLEQIITNYGTSDEVWRLLGRCCNNFARDIDAGSIVTENTALAAKHLIAAMVAAQSIQAPGEKDKKRFLKYRENLAATMEDIQDTLNKLDGMRSLFQPTMNIFASSSVSSTFFNFPRPQPAAAPQASVEKKEESRPQQRMGA